MTTISINRYNVREGLLRLAVAGEVDTDACDLLAAAIRDAINAAGVAELIVDLDQVTFLNSSGVRVLITGRDVATEHAVTYRVANPHGIVRKVLDVTGVLPELTK